MNRSRHGFISHFFIAHTKILVVLTSCKKEKSLSRAIMVDSCFKIFRKSSCLNKNLSKSHHRDSFDSFYSNDKFAIGSGNKKCNFAANSRDNNEKQPETSSDNIITDIDYHDFVDGEADTVILRRHNRKYLYSVSTVSNDAMSSDDDDNETLDILYPLPHVKENTHERSLVDESKRIDNGRIIRYFFLLFPQKNVCAYLQHILLFFSFFIRLVRWW